MIKIVEPGFQSLNMIGNIVALGDVPIRIGDKLQIGDGCTDRRRVLPSSEAGPRATLQGILNERDTPAQLPPYSCLCQINLKT